MRKPKPQILASLLSLAVFAPAVAQDLEGNTLEDELIEAPEIRRYSVEVIVFKYSEPCAIWQDRHITISSPGTTNAEIGRAHV